jgi:Flp pilus assembly protein TadD
MKSIDNLLNQAIRMHTDGKWSDARNAYEQILESFPHHAKTLNLLGATYLQIGEHQKSLPFFEQALNIKPDFIEACNNLAVALKWLERFDEAIACYRKVLALKPDYALAHYNLGNILRELGRHEEAIACYREAIALRPDWPQAHSNLGISLKELKRYEEAEAAYRQAIFLKPDYGEARCNLSFILLATGRFNDGWQEYEFRREVSPQKLPPLAATLTQWFGQNVPPGESLLIFEEQGFGDKLQFTRYLPKAMGRFMGGVSFVVDRPLLTLFQRSFPEVEMLAAAPSHQGKWQWHCPLLSLPLAFGTTLETIPAKTPYLISDPVKVSRWKARIEALGLSSATRKIGVVWKCGKGMKIASLKSLDIAHLAPLLTLPSCAWFSLQKELDEGKSSWVSSGKLIDWADELSDFDETAALIMNMDLVISVDTSVAHLAGALGRPVWLLNRYASDWRWMRNREDSPWYPTMRIFTQKTAGDWDEVAKRMASALNEPES